MFVLDIKSMNSMIFRNLTQPKEENIDQLQLYLHYFKVPKGILLYVDKDRLELKDFVVGYNRKRALGLIESLTEIKKKIDSEVIPARIPDYPENWQCRYCQFKEICSMANGGDVKWGEFKKKMKKLKK